MRIANAGATVVTIALVAAVGLTLTHIADAQQGAPSIAALQDQIAILTTALKACQTASTSQASAPVSARQDAVTALRAVQSALAGGANIAAFKKYQLDAKI